MPSPAAAAAAPGDGTNRRSIFADEPEADLDDDSEMEMDEDTDESEEDPDPDPDTPAVEAAEDLNSSPSSSTDDDGKSTAAEVSPLPKQLVPISIAVAAVPSHNGGLQIQPYSASPTPAPFETTPDAKRMKLEVRSEERKATASSLEDSRRLFQRLWTDEDEIKILQGFYEFTSQRGTTHHAHQHDTGPFYEQIRTKLQLDFNKNQLVEKLRRLKKKYRNVINRMGSGKDFVFKSAHDQATFEISRKIWSNSVAKGVGNYDQEDDDANDGESHEQQPQKMRPRRRKRAAAAASLPPPLPLPPPPETVPVEVKAAAIPTTFPTTPNSVSTAAVTTPPPVNMAAVEEAMRSCLSPMIKEMVQAAGHTGSPMMMPLGGFMGSIPKDGEAGERWRKQHILELEVYSKRLELVQEHIKATLDELRSSGC